MLAADLALWLYYLFSFIHNKYYNFVISPVFEMLKHTNKLIFNDFDIECTNMQHESMSNDYVSLFEVKITSFDSF